MSRRKDEGPRDPLMAEISRLAEQYGDPEVLRVCLTVLQRYAELGARAALTRRKGDPEIACPVCRERNAAAKQLEETLKRVENKRPIGGAAPSQAEDDESR